MAAFSELDWTRFDVHALAANAGVAVVEHPRFVMPATRGSPVTVK